MSEQLNIRRYKAKEVWKDYEVTLEVDHNTLTVERAAMINGFWSNHKNRLFSENSDVVRAVVRYFGQTMINMMLSEGGCSFIEHSGKRSLFDCPAPIWTKDLHDEEGWGGSIEGSFYGWCGIRVIAADVECPGFDDVELAEVTND